MRRAASLMIASLFCVSLLSAAAARPAPQPEAPPGKVEQVGHNALMNRGMNAALAVHGDYVYVGSRTDATHPNAGIMVVDVADPESPTIVHQIPGRIGETSREMRVWPEEDLLIVQWLSSNCSFIIHACSPTQLQGEDTFRFYDISGDKAAAPELVSEYVSSSNPHEFFLWDDPKRPGRALMFISTPGGGQTQLLVTDISKAREGEFAELAEWSTIIPEAGDNRLHSIGVSTDGTRGFLAYLEGGFLIVDTSDVAAGLPKPTIELVTSMPDRPHWEGPGAHSAVKLPGRDYALVTDEVYGYIPGLLGDHGCPWGWTRIIDIKNPVKPTVVAEYKTEANEPEYCDSPVTNPPVRHSLSSHSAHNPTLTRNLAFITWHSEGLQVVSLKNPRKPVQAAEFVPTPEPVVVTEDPALSSGIDKVVMWSFPVIKDGLIYVVDVRNGLYVLRYSGPFESEVAKVKFLEGNSNLGDALKFEKVKSR